jgi:inorganic pyrophosphatase
MVHPWHGIGAGPKAPGEVVAVIEIPSGGNVKYELDKETGLLRMDRVLYSSVHYPANYGFIPGTYAEDNDPLDILVYCQEPLAPLAMVIARPIGVLTMYDDMEADHKIVAVARDDPEYASVRTAKDLPRHRLNQLFRFFEDYKKLEGKTVDVDALDPNDDPAPVILDAVKRYGETFGGEG